LRIEEDFIMMSHVTVKAMVMRLGIAFRAHCGPLSPAGRRACRSEPRI